MLVLTPVPHTPLSPSGNEICPPGGVMLVLTPVPHTPLSPSGNEICPPGGIMLVLTPVPHTPLSPSFCMYSLQPPPARISVAAVPQSGGAASKRSRLASLMGVGKAAMPRTSPAPPPSPPRTTSDMRGGSPEAVFPRALSLWVSPPRPHNGLLAPQNPPTP
jgi:hypothetical protein